VATPSDNIPGAPGIGDKGSVEIIKRFGSVEAALGPRPPKWKEEDFIANRCRDNRDIHFLFSKSMATIDTNVPVEFNVGAMRAGEPDLASLRQLFTETGIYFAVEGIASGSSDRGDALHEAQSAADVRGCSRFYRAGSFGWPSRLIWIKQSRCQ